jgi:quinol monooxygenase YgiN
MPEIAYIVKVTTAPGRRDETLAALGKVVDATEQEPGTLQYLMHADGAEADVIWFYEIYADRGAFEAHMGSSAMAEAGGALGGLLAGAPEIHQVEIVRRRGDGG